MSWSIFLVYLCAYICMHTPIYTHMTLLCIHMFVCIYTVVYIRFVTRITCKLLAVRIKRIMELLIMLALSLFVCRLILKIFSQQFALNLQSVCQLLMLELRICVTICVCLWNRISSLSRRFFFTDSVSESTFLSYFLCLLNVWTGPGVKVDSNSDWRSRSRFSSSDSPHSLIDVAFYYFEK